MTEGPISQFVALFPVLGLGGLNSGRTPRGELYCWVRLECLSGQRGTNRMTNYEIVSVLSENPDVCMVILFGSLSRGQFSTGSDLNLAAAVTRPLCYRE
jgi:hypothetical protein